MPNPPPSDPVLRTTGFAAFRHRDFSLFFIGRLFGFGSYQMTMVALTYQIYDVTGDPVRLALVHLILIAPTFLFFLPAGYVADVFDRRLVLLSSYIVTALGTVGLLLLSVLGMAASWPLFVLLFVIGTARAFSGPTNNAIVPNLVPIPVFPNAVSWNTSGVKMAQIGGPVLGGFLYLAGPEVVYGTASALFVVGTVATALIRRRAAGAAKGRVDLKSLFAGLGYVYRKKMLLGAIVVDFLVCSMAAVPALLPIFAKDILGVGAAGAGVLRSAMALGGLSSSLVLAQFPIARQAGARMLLGASLFGVSIVVFGLSTSFALSLVALLAVGAADMININVRQTLLQIATPDEMRGRVSAVNSISANIGTDLAGVQSGMMAAAIGAAPAAIVGGVVIALVALACFKVFPDLARVDRMDRLL